MKREIEVVLLTLMVMFALFGLYATVRIVILEQPENCEQVGP